VKRRERLHSGKCRGTWEWGFIAFFALPEGGDVSQVQTEVSWEGEVSLTTYHLLGPPAVCPSILFIYSSFFGAHFWYFII
jgi:hypothetical protein